MPVYICGYKWVHMRYNLIFLTFMHMPKRNVVTPVPHVSLDMITTKDAKVNYIPA